MKTFKLLLQSSVAVAIIAVAISCEGITNPEPIPVIDSTKTATIVGTAYVNLDLSNDTTGAMEQDYERVPANTVVKIVLDANDFSNSATSGQKLTYTTTVGAGGTFSIEVPAVSQPIDAEIYMDSFIAAQTQMDGTQQEEVFVLSFTNPTPVMVTAELTTFVEATYAVR